MARLRIVTFNVFHDYPRQQHAEKRLDLLVEALAGSHPDVVLLQEMFVSRDLGHWTERLVLELRSRGVDYDSFYGAANGSFADNGAFEEGCAILSRFPIVEREQRFLADGHEVWRTVGDHAYLEHRAALRATLEIERTLRLDAFSAHVTDLAPATIGPSPRRLQIEDLVRFVSSRPNGTVPAIVGGDLNAEPGSEDVLALEAAGFVDPFRARDDILTSDSRGRMLEDPSTTADRRIDYVLLAGSSPGAVRVHEARPLLDSAAEIGPGLFLWASDHNGLLLDCEIPIDPGA